MLFRRAVIDQVGLYDPSLRIAEDFDLCVRARQAGWRVVFEPKAVSEHRHPRSTVASYLRYQYKIGRYGCRFRLKHRAAVPFGRWYPTTPARAVLLAPVYVTMALGRIVTKNVAVGAIRPLLWYLPLIAFGQCWVVAGVIRGLATPGGGRSSSPAARVRLPRALRRHPVLQSTNSSFRFDRPPAPSSSEGPSIGRRPRRVRACRETGAGR